MFICLLIVAMLDSEWFVDRRDDVEDAEVTVFLSHRIHLLLSENVKYVTRRHLVFLDRWAILMD